MADTEVRQIAELYCDLRWHPHYSTTNYYSPLVRQLREGETGCDGAPQPPTVGSTDHCWDCWQFSDCSPVQYSPVLLCIYQPLPVWACSNDDPPVSCMYLRLGLWWRWREVSPFIIIITGWMRVRRQIWALNITNMGSSIMQLLKIWLNPVNPGLY